MKLIVNDQIKLLSHAMNAYSLRQKMTASNISNIDTPGYKRISVSFEEELRHAGKFINHGKALTNVAPQVTQQDQKPILEDEMMEMADTQMRTQLVARALRENFEQLKLGISG